VSFAFYVDSSISGCKGSKLRVSLLAVNGVFFVVLELYHSTGILEISGAIWVSVKEMHVSFSSCNCGVSLGKLFIDLKEIITYKLVFILFSPAKIKSLEVIM
jgi:membrane-bound ClpP family serine protease